MSLPPLAASGLEGVLELPYSCLNFVKFSLLPSAQGKSEEPLRLLDTITVFTTYNFSNGRTANDNSKLLENGFRDFLLR